MAEITRILETNFLSCADAQKLVGRLSFAGSTIVGRLGRAYLYVFYKFVATGGLRPSRTARRLNQQLRYLRVAILRREIQ